MLNVKQKYFGSGLTGLCVKKKNRNRYDTIQLKIKNEELRIKK